MALAKMESVDLDADKFRTQSTKSLMMRMQSFKTSLIAKQGRNEALRYEDSSGSLSASSIEEEDSSQ